MAKEGLRQAVLCSEGLRRLCSSLPHVPQATQATQATPEAPATASQAVPGSARRSLSGPGRGAGGRSRAVKQRETSRTFLEELRKEASRLSPGTQPGESQYAPAPREAVCFE